METILQDVGWPGPREEKRNPGEKPTLTIRRSYRIEFRECMASDAVSRLFLIPSLLLIPFLVQQVEARRKSVTNDIIIILADRP